jgi:DNA-binding transcriptional LysR family regulator
VALRYVSEVDNIDTIKRFVEVGQGIAIVPEPAVQSEAKSETLTAVQFSDEELSRPLGIIHRKGRPFSLAAERFVEFLTSKTMEDEVEENSTSA